MKQVNVSMVSPVCASTAQQMRDRNMDAAACSAVCAAQPGQPSEQRAGRG